MTWLSKVGPELPVELSIRVHRSGHSGTARHAPATLLDAIKYERHGVVPAPLHYSRRRQQPKLFQSKLNDAASDCPCDLFDGYNYYEDRENNGQCFVVAKKVHCRGQLNPAPTCADEPKDDCRSNSFFDRCDVATKVGKHSGRIAPATMAAREAPAARKAMPGFRMVSSMRSEKKRAQKSIVSMIIARIPASGPSPTATTKINAQIRSGTP